jgi:hypothetical protein
MGKGFLFFSDDFNNFAKGGTISATSNDALKDNAFDNSKITRWVSSGEGTDGNQVTLERGWSASKSFDAIYIRDTNIGNIEFAYFIGAAYTNIDSGNATIISSADGSHWYIRMNTRTTCDGIRVRGNTSIPANKEKYIGDIYTFQVIGQFEGYMENSTNIDPNQKIEKLLSGKNVVIEKGEGFSTKLNFKAHNSQADIDLITEIAESKAPFFLWMCGGDVSQFKYISPPFRFKDIFKCSVFKGRKLSLPDNFYGLGFDSTIQFVEVA